MADESDERIQRDTRRLADAMHRLNAALAEPEASSKSWEDTAQAFEYAMDLFWRVAKELLAKRGIDARMPRQAVQAAYERGWIADPALWIEMLKDEYEMSGGIHNPPMLQRLYPRIRSYYPEFCRVHARMVEHMEDRS